MNTAVRFSLPLNFMDPQKTEDGKIWAKEKFLSIIQERQYISKRINTSYSDTGEITPFEREMIIQNIHKEDEQSKEVLENLSNQNKSR